VGPSNFSPPDCKRLLIHNHSTAHSYSSCLLVSAFFGTVSLPAPCLSPLISLLLKPDTTPPLYQTKMTDKEEAIKLKEKGNEAFKKHDWPTAISFYTQAIAIYDKEASFFTNRAQVGASSTHATPRNRLLTYWLLLGKHPPRILRPCHI
jgi:hypothetical protein